VSLQVRRLDCTELQIQARRQTGRDPGMKFARVHIRDQLLHGVSHGTDFVQPRQRIDIFGGTQTDLGYYGISVNVADSIPKSLCRHAAS